ncbi:MAG: response regulator [Lewinellaceae bacterium]|nr:response regulator [Lewinellaceae bacterium]
MQKELYSIVTVVCLIMYSVHSLSGQAFEIDSLQPSYLLSESVEVMEEPVGGLSIEEVLDIGGDAGFVPWVTGKDSYRPGRFYWARAKVSNRLGPSSGQSSWVFHFAPSLTYVDAYIVQGGQVSSRHQTGFFRPYYEKGFRPRIQPNLAKVTLEPGETALLYFRARADRMAMLPEFWVEILPADVFWAQLVREYWSSGLFLGFVLMMLVYNLILSFTIWDKAHFYYSFYLVTIAGYQLYASRLLADWLAPVLFVEQPQHLYFFRLVAYGGLVAYLGFMRSFLHLETLLPRWDRLFRWLMVLSVPVLIVDAFLIWYSNFSPNVSDWAIIPFTFVFLCATFLFAWPLYRTGDKKGNFVVAGIICMGLGILLTIILRLQSIEYSSAYFKMGSVLEIIAFALGLAYSRRVEARERQQGKFELEKSRLLQEKEHAEAERLKELDELKSQLYTNITHEFRTPLTVIMGMAAEIKGQDKARSIIHRNGHNMLRLVNQMLALSKLESGQMKLDLIQADIIAYLQYLAESFHSLASAKYIRLAFYSEENQLVMDFDEEKIQHIAYNLLSNAIKFTPEYGKVTFHTRKVSLEGRPFLQIIVQDTGAGISEQRLPFIFDRFYSGGDGPPASRQGENPEGKNKGAILQSTGIGLALAKELVGLMGGVILVESDVGAGSKFIVRIPITNNAPHKAPALLDQWEAPAPLPEEMAQEEMAVPDSEAPILLLAEDNPDIVFYIRSVLKGRYNLLLARNGEEALAQAIGLVPDIIISDVMMPLMDGFELCTRLKEDERTSHIPLILLTARTAEADKVKGLKRGADAYLTKPFNKEELLVRIEKLIEKQERLRLYFSNGLPEEQRPAEDLSIESAFLKKARNLVEADIGNQELAIADLCEAAHLSHTQFYRKLKALTDKTPSQFVRSIRLEKAREMLETTQMNISEIAYSVGFNDPNYFSRSFQQEYGVAPSSVRKT